MEYSKKRIIPLLILILVLAAVAAVLMWQPNLLDDWLDGEVPGEQPSTPTEPTDPIEPSDPIDPIEPTEPTDPTQPVEPDAPLSPIVAASGETYGYNEMVEDIKALVMRYSDRLRLSIYGASADGRALYAVTLGSPQATSQVIVTAGIHAREYANCYVVMRQLEYYLEHYDTTQYGGMTYRQLFERVNIVLAPMTNPDGIMMAEEGLSSLRDETLRQGVTEICARLGYRGTAEIDAYLKSQWKCNARGVDINRNFSALWQEHQDGAGQPSSKNYKGETPLSEPETEALVRLTQSLSDPVASLCMHSQGNIIYWKSPRTDAAGEANRELSRLVADITGYAPQDNEQNPTEPSYSNWTVMTYGLPTVTVENGLGGYPQTLAMAEEFLARNLQLWAAVAERYGR